MIQCCKPICNIYTPMVFAEMKHKKTVENIFKWMSLVTSVLKAHMSLCYLLLKPWHKQDAQRATYRAPEYSVLPFWGIDQGVNFCLLIGPKNTNMVEDAEILLPVKKFHWIPFRWEVKNVSANQRPGWLSCFYDRHQNINLVEDVGILLPVKFSWIPFSGFRGEVPNVSANQRPGRPSCFSDRPEKHKLGRGHWDLASCQVSLNSIQWFQRRSRKCLSQSEAGQPSCFSDRPEKHKLGRGRWDLPTCQVSSNSVQWFQRRSRKCLGKSEARAAILFFWSARKT